MKNKKDKTLLALGIVFTIYWLIDFLYNAVLKNDYSWVLWYSSAGFLLTGIALIIQNKKLIYSLFCALFVLEIIWILDFFYILFSHHSLVGFTAYMQAPGFNTRDIYVTMYHILIPIGLLLAVLRIKKPYKYGWVGAVIFTSILVVLTYFFTNPISSQVNCIHSINRCNTVFAFLYAINNPYRTLIGLVSLTLLVFIPTNYALLQLKKKV